MEKPRNYRIQPALCSSLRLGKTEASRSYNYSSRQVSAKSLTQYCTCLSFTSRIVRKNCLEISQTKGKGSSRRTHIFCEEIVFNSY